MCQHTQAKNEMWRDQRHCGSNELIEKCVIEKCVMMSILVECPCRVVVEIDFPAVTMATAGQ